MKSLGRASFEGSKRWRKGLSEERLEMSLDGMGWDGMGCLGRVT